MHDEATDCFGPQIGIFGHHLCRQPGQKRRGRTRGIRCRQEPVGGAMMGRQKAEARHTDGAQRVFGGIAAFAHHVRLDRPVPLPSQRCRAERAQAASGCDRRVGARIRFGDCDKVRAGADRESIPGLGRVMYPIGVIAGRVFWPSIRVPDISSRDDQQARMSTISVNIRCERIEYR